MLMRLDQKRFNPKLVLESQNRYLKILQPDWIYAALSSDVIER